MSEALSDLTDGITPTLPTDAFLAAHEVEATLHPIYLSEAVGNLVDSSGNYEGDGKAATRALGNMIVQGDLSAESAATIAAYLEQGLEFLAARTGSNVDIRWSKR